MNKIIFITVMFFSIFSFSKPLKITTSKEFQFTHCVPSASKETDVVLHLVVDIRSDKQHKLYSDKSLKSQKAKQLTNLTLIDDKLVSNSLDYVDVSWVSAKNDITLALNVLDDGGYGLSGDLLTKNTKTPYTCTDLSLEK